MLEEYSFYINCWWYI